MSPSISCRRVGSTEGGRLYPPVIGFQVRSWEGVVELNTSCRHWQSESQDSALNLDPLDRTRFSRHEIPDLVDLHYLRFITKSFTWRAARCLAGYTIAAGQRGRAEGEERRLQNTERRKS